MADKDKRAMTQKRRRFLKAASATIVAGTIPATATATSEDKEISADIVEPGKPETAREFVRKTVNADDMQDVREAYRNLSDKQLDAVRDAFNELSSTQITVKTPDKSQSASTNDISTAAHKVEGSATVTQSIAGITAYTLTLGLYFDVEDGKIVSNAGTTFDRSTPSSTWHYKTLVSGEPGVDTETKHGYTAVAKFTLSVGGQHIDTEYPKINLVGHADGTFEESKTILESW